MPLTRAETRYGVLVGVPGEEPQTTVFRGVPFAKPPIGALRLHRPVDPDPWEGERICDKWPNAPVAEDQVYRNFYPESEDCLYMNIFTPAASAEEKLPVMFWIYGGGFRFGSICNAYNGEHHAGEAWLYTGEAINKKGCILVTPNYRCSLLGYGTHPRLLDADGNGGNYGLWDLIQALRFVHENIAAFGGDPDNVTIFGHSAGGVSVKMLLASGQTRGLFRHAIIQSGSGMSGPERVHSPEWVAEWVEKAMDSLGYTFDDLMTMDAFRLEDEIPHRIYELYGGFAPSQPIPWQRRPSVFGPMADGAALKCDPGIAMYAGDYDPDVDIMIGTVLQDNVQPIKACQDEVKEDPEILRAIAYSASVAFGERCVQAGRRPIYGYFFERNVPPAKPGVQADGRDTVPFANRTGPYHGAEFPYIFGKMEFMQKQWTDWDYELQEILISYWTNFAKNGNPNGEGLPYWPPYTAETPFDLNIRDDAVEARNLVDTAKGRRVIRHLMTHPGYTETLKDYILNEVKTPE